ncbi:MAG: helix-turn-helix domain-containing protein [Spirochaetaceae bacterium]|nr:helix-turn-helix domain-containing protein [Spirochaetaceae bacterium]MCF7947580.1 helix-turn-helix domain-containing protein [Spirochaetia bacterium]MCF7950504.1 helix-turn-helix domain-containing protein [Spirochaetaceae bacterium]
MDAKQLGRNIRKFREEAGLSQQSLADQLNISFQQLQKYEYGQSRITVERMIDISRILKVPIAQLLPKTPEDSVQDSYSAESESFAPFERVLVSPEETALLKVFRRIHSPRVRSILLQQAKAWVEAERDMLNRTENSE